jgi:transposase InsO family protein
LSFRSIDPKHRLRGLVLAMVKFLFPDGAPTLEAYCRQTGVASSTFERAARWLLGLLPGLLRERRPGPKGPEPATPRDAREAALRALEDLRAWLQDKCATTEKNTCYSAEAKERIARVSQDIRASGALGYAEIAHVLGMDERQLRRIRRDVEAAGGDAPPPKSRRPHCTADLHVEIQRRIRQIAISSARYTPTDVKRILEKRYRQDLERHHGAPTISLTTVAKYMPRDPKPAAKPAHPRGAYDYPEPFQQVAIDTTHLKLFGWTFYLVTVFEVAGRLNLLTRVFVRENTAAIVEVIEKCLARYPGIEAFVIDRGSPYLNPEVKRLLEERGTLRIVAPPATPTAKAALERHFLTLKDALRRAIAAVFGHANPDWPRGHVVKLLEMGAAVFQELYHRIPQHEIDGKSPAERCQGFDPVRAAEKMTRLFERSLESEPAADYARQLHRRFQLPNPEARTVAHLKRFGTGVLRDLVDQVAPYLGPPLPEWMYDPLGYLEAKARQIWEARQRRLHQRRYDQAVAAHRQEDAKAAHQTLADEARQRKESPEAFLDDALHGLANGIAIRIPALVRVFTNQLEPLLRSLAEQLGHAFLSEAKRLRERALALATAAPIRTELATILDGLFEELRAEGAAC